MKMLDAYRKARRMADEQHDSAIVVTVDNERLPRSQCYDAVTLDDWQRDESCGQFFDFVAEVQP
jgi:hypothetical protein